MRSITDGSYICKLCGEAITGCSLCGEAPMIKTVEGRGRNEN